MFQRSHRHLPFLFLSFSLRFFAPIHPLLSRGNLSPGGEALFGFKFDAESWKTRGQKQREREQKNPEEAVVCVIHHLW